MKRVVSIFIILASLLYSKNILAQHKDKTLFITYKSVLNEIDEDGKYNLAHLLARLGKDTQDEVARRGDKKSTPKTAGEYVANVLAQSHNEQIRHLNTKFLEQLTRIDFNQTPFSDSDKRYAEFKLTREPYKNREMDALFRVWMSEDRVKALGNRFELFQTAPFRMLAIVNRMDLAGDYDDRINNEPTAEPRAFGEIHIIYGLIDQEYERNSGQAFPMTFEITYKLPPLKVQNGNVVIDNDVTWKDLVNEYNKGNKKWVKISTLWANEWGKLADLEASSPEYRDQLRRILNLSAKPRNFISLKNNTRVRDDNNLHELREWYVVDEAQRGRELMLVPRKPKREPYRCLDGSDLIAYLVRYYWDSSKGDLDMSTRNVYGPRGRRGDKDRAGYAILRDSRRGLIAGYVDENNFVWKGANCSEVQGNKVAVPYQMIQGINGVVNLDGNDEEEAPRLVTLAPFGRTKPGDIWEMPNLGEKKRHAFAIRTCTGCHSSETGTYGFHVSPRLKNERSQLSDFLRGGAQFKHSGATYNYNRLESRKEIMKKFLEGTAELYEGLYLPELQQ